MPKIRQLLLADCGFYGRVSWGTPKWPALQASSCSCSSVATSFGCGGFHAAIGMLACVGGSAAVAGGVHIAAEGVSHPTALLG